VKKLYLLETGWTYKRSAFYGSRHIDCILGKSQKNSPPEEVSLEDENHTKFTQRPGSMRLPKPEGR